MKKLLISVVLLSQTLESSAMDNLTLQDLVDIKAEKVFQTFNTLVREEADQSAMIKKQMDQDLIDSTEGQQVVEELETQTIIAEDRDEILILPSLEDLQLSESEFKDTDTEENKKKVQAQVQIQIQKSIIFKQIDLTTKQCMKQLNKISKKKYDIPILPEDTAGQSESEFKEDDTEGNAKTLETYGYSNKVVIFWEPFQNHDIDACELILAEKNLKKER